MEIISQTTATNYIAHFDASVKYCFGFELKDELIINDWARSLNNANITKIVRIGGRISTRRFLDKSVKIFRELVRAQTIARKTHTFGQHEPLAVLLVFRGPWLTRDKASLDKKALRLKKEDCDNKIKGTLDALECAKIIHDHQVTMITALKVQAEDKQTVIRFYNKV